MHYIGFLYGLSDFWMSFLFAAKQYPRKFADQRDSGYFIGFWDEGPPKNQLYYSSEVILMSFFLAFDIANILPACHALSIGKTSLNLHTHCQEHLVVTKLVKTFV